MKYMMKPTALISIIVSALLLACSQGSDTEKMTTAEIPKELENSRNHTNSDVVQLSAIQKEIVKKFGPPESFKLFISKEDNKTVRSETWDYYRLETRYAFIDGNLEAEAVIEDVPNWTLLPVDYRPEQFADEMSLEEVQKRIIGDKPFESLDLPDDLLPGAQLNVIGSDQIIMGFERGKLIYVETVPLFPNEAEMNEGGAE